jgi:hypothetical protein
MKTLSIINDRKGGSLFHYAHFIIDCLYVEIINDVYKYDIVYREKNIHQTLGNFSKIYEEVMKNKNIELVKGEFDSLDIKPVIFERKENYTDIIYLNKFREFIFTRYNINSLEYNKNYPEVILIKRGERIELIDDESLKKINTNITTGKERREIKNIERIEKYLKEKYCDKFKSFYMEKESFQEQVKIFNNAKLIIMAHGAAISSVLFCKSETTLIEVTCQRNFIWFDIFIEKLKINHVKIEKNEPDHIIEYLDKDIHINSNFS